MNVKTEKDPPKRQKQLRFLNCDHLILLTKVVIVVVSTSVLIWQLSKCLNRYLQYETTAILSVKRTGDSTFVAFTVCPAYEHAYKDHILRKYGSSRASYQRGFYAMNDSAQGKSAEEVYDEVTWSLPEILSEVVVQTATQAQPEVSIPVEVDMDPAIGIWDPKYHTLYGKCWSLVLASNLTSMGLNQLLFSSKINIYIFLHHPGQFQDYNSMTKLHGVIGKKSFIDVAYELTQNTREDDQYLPCSAKQDFEFDNCLTSKGPERVHSVTGCTVPYVPNKFPKCDPKDSAKLWETITEYKNMALNDQKSICPRPCSFIETFTGLPEANGQAVDVPDGVELGHINIYLKSTTKINKIVLDYPILTAVAEVGGYTGLLLGVSFVNMVSILDRAVKHLRN